MTGSHVRHEVIEMLLSADIDRSDFTEWPWDLIHKDGSRFSEAESVLANSASLEELGTAYRLAAASLEFYQRKQAELQHAYDLAATVVRGDDNTASWAEAVSRLPPEEQAEIAEILAKYPEERAAPRGGMTAVTGKAPWHG